MDSNRAKDAAKKAGGVVLVAAGLGIGSYILLILADIATFWWFFNRMSTVMAARGVDSDLAHIFGTAFAMFSAVAAHGVLWLLLTRKTRLWALRIGAIALVWYGAKYAVSYPYSDGPINVWSGKAQAMCYRDNSTGRIIRMPIGAKSGPEGQPLQVMDSKTAEEYTQQDTEKETLFNVYTGLPQFKYYRDSQNRIVSMPLAAKTGPEGQPLQVIDQKTAEEYTKQDSKKETISEETTSAIGTPADLHQVASGQGGNSYLKIQAEKVQVAPDRTIVFLACRTDTLSRILRYNSVPYTYLVDDSGHVYDVRNESADTSIKDDTNHTIRVDEVYRFSLAFPPLPQGVSKLKLHLFEFYPALDLDSIFAKAEKIPTTVDTPVPPKPVQVTSVKLEDNLVLWIEKIQTMPDQTVLELACKGRDETQEGHLRPSSTYLTDESGRVYGMVEESVIYDWIVYDRNTNWFRNIYDTNPIHLVRKGEIFRFTMVFRPIHEKMMKIQLHRDRFQPALDLSQALANTEKIPPVNTETR